MSHVRGNPVREPAMAHGAGGQTTPIPRLVCKCGEKEGGVVIPEVEMGKRRDRVFPGKTLDLGPSTLSRPLLANQDWPSSAGGSPTWAFCAPSGLWLVSPPQPPPWPRLVLSHHHNRIEIICHLFCAFVGDNGLNKGMKHHRLWSFSLFMASGRAISVLLKSFWRGHSFYISFSREESHTKTREEWRLGES